MEIHPLILRTTYVVVLLRILDGIDPAPGS